MPAETFFAAGCGANTTLLPAAIRLMALLITVAAGLVDGVTEATTPHGAFSISVRPLSPVSTCGDKHSTPGVPRACATFLANLSSTRPMPVSLTASSANSRACFRPLREWHEWQAGASPRSSAPAGPVLLPPLRHPWRQNAHLMNSTGRLAAVFHFQQHRFHHLFNILLIHDVQSYLWKTTFPPATTSSTMPMTHRSTGDNSLRCAARGTAADQQYPLSGSRPDTVDSDGTLPVGVATGIDHFHHQQFVMRQSLMADGTYDLSCDDCQFHIRLHGLPVGS